MSLAVYSKPDADFAFTSLNPFRVTFHGRTGGSQDHLVFVRNDDILRSYKNIYIEAVDTIAPSYIDGTTEGYEWKLASKLTPLTFEEWRYIAPANRLSLPSIGSKTVSDIKTFLPVWVRVRIPPRQSVNNLTDIILRITATEILV